MALGWPVIVTKIPKIPKIWASG